MCTGLSFMDEHPLVCPMVGSGAGIDVTPMSKGLIVTGSEVHKGHTSMDIRGQVFTHVAPPVLGVRRVQMGQSGFFSNEAQRLQFKWPDSKGAPMREGLEHSFIHSFIHS